MPKKSFDVTQVAENGNVSNVIMQKPAEGKLDIEPSKSKDPGLWRDLTAYWIFGLCNNFGYVVMLTAAHAIISELSGNHNIPVKGSGVRDCNIISTGAILLADIIPSLLIKSISPFLPFWNRTRITVSCFIAALGFAAVAFATEEWQALAGVALTSLASGLGEPTFLAYSAYFNKNVISTWSSGTGGAGIVGSLAYIVLRDLAHLSNQQTLLVMISVPAIEMITFFGLLRNPSGYVVENNTKNPEEANLDLPPMTKPMEKILYVKHLLHYMMPLALVYFFEYFINQGLFELAYFPDIWLTISQQYQWYQVTYQIGVFISRSSVNIVHIKHIWIMAVLQGLNVIFFTFEAVYMFTPNIWILLGIILFEGLLGGGAYVNTFYRMSKEVPANRREFSMGVVTLSDSVGITLAGFAAMPTHNAICALPPGLRYQ